ncbi:MAG: phosphoribosylpyrophosphate synthetase [Arenibacter latericius]|uniref:phosphoribosylpyrophosphate synthetase n=1 Tax=Arenibacter TaxID=178469 RepID=UPI000A3B3C83|nr:MULTISPECIES: phosphoribosylpyrophosphate synthetase [Arenibacter]MDX1365685.1 phosphoribosylpyrophosphate synthetase [Arenibacter latericius]
MKESYQTLSEAITDLKQAGYTQDLNLAETGLEDKELKRMHAAHDFNVVKYYRFEGVSDPDDNAVLFVIETVDGDKGLLVDAYGAYSGNVSKEVMDKLRIIR